VLNVQHMHYVHTPWEITLPNAYIIYTTDFIYIYVSVVLYVMTTLMYAYVHDTENCFIIFELFYALISSYA